MQFSAFSPSWAVVGFFFSFRGLSSSSYAALHRFFVMYASVRVKGKLLEVIGGDGCFFPFKVVDASRRKISFIRLSFQEFRWVAVQMVRFCFSKGEPLWLKTFRWGQRCLLLQMRKNSKGRFIVLSLLRWWACLLYTSPSPRDGLLSRMPSSA